MKPISILITSSQTLTDLEDINDMAVSEDELGILLEIYKEKGIDGVQDSISRTPIGTDRMDNLIGYELLTTIGWREVINCIILNYQGAINYAITYKDEPNKGYVVDKNGYAQSHRIYQIRPPKTKKTKAQHELEMQTKALTRKRAEESKQPVTKSQALRQAAHVAGMSVSEFKVHNPDYLELAFPLPTKSN